MSRTPHTPKPRLPLGLAALSAGLFLAGCSAGHEPVATQPGVLAGTAPSTGPEQSLTSTTVSVPTPVPTAHIPTSPVPTSTRPVGTTATTSAAPSADVDQSLAGLDRDLADLDHQLADADHDVATPEGDIR